MGKNSSKMEEVMSPIGFRNQKSVNRKANRVKSGQRDRRIGNAFRGILASFVLGAFLVGLIGCGQPSKLKVVKIDWATYSPVGLVLREKKFLEEDLAKDGVQVEWVQSLGSNKALELLNSKSIDFGSTAGAAAFIGKANGNPIKSVYVLSKPEWTALVVTKKSRIQKIEDLKGKKVAVTRGTDPHVFLLRALDSVGLSEKDVELVPLQHADGRNALEKGDVDAWAGLDPLMAQTEVDKGSRLFFRDPSRNTYNLLDVREEFAKQHPEYVKRVIAAYEKARLWALQNPEEYKQIFEREAKIDDAVASKVLGRTDISQSQIGDVQKQTISAAGGVLKKSGVIKDTVDVEKVVSDLIDPQYGPDVQK
jgi:sulfonate transport system substrate-binding protein